MNYNNFGNTDLKVSEIGFGAWGIGGPAMAGDIPIGWGDVEDETSVAALKKAFDQGVNFYDTADFYGFGHSEELIGQVFGNRPDVIVASKVGHRLDENEKIFTDYSGDYILKACDESLHRLKRDHIDYYQLHTAKVADLEKGDCVEALERLKQEGKIRYWGVSLNTFYPEPEAEFLLKNNLGSGFQIVFNVINQKAAGIVEESRKKGFGIIARMPLQFGLLTGKFNINTRFDENDHRSFRLTKEVLESSLDSLEKVWPLADELEASKTGFSLGFLTSYPGVSTVIPGIKTPLQAVQNTDELIKMPLETLEKVKGLYKSDFARVMEMMEQAG